MARSPGRHNYEPSATLDVVTFDRAVLLTAAARNNAAWCDTVCRSHGIVGTYGAGMWTSLVRTPRLYPDAVTLDPLVAAGDVLGAVDASPGCTIKDSFATLDLSPHGFEVLFEAMWIACASMLTGADSTITWARVTTLAQFETWEDAWRGADAEAAGILVPSLRSDTSVEILTGIRRGVLVAGAILNRTDDVIGLSNVFTRDGDHPEVWPSLAAWVARSQPGRTVVGYESGADLDAAIGAGFTPVGTLRVWSRPLP